MKKILILIALFVLSTTDVLAARRTHVVIHKRPPHVSTQPVAVPVVLIPPLGMFYDLARRTNCEGDVLGLGGPGFSEPMPVGNVMTTAYMRGECPTVAPRRR